MKDFGTLITVLILTIFLNSCHTKDRSNENSIVIDPMLASEFVPLSEFVDDVQFIKLETSEESIILNAKEIIIKDNFIYVIDITLKAVLIFDKKGKFISKLNKLGEGPDQYRNLGPVFVSDDESTIEVIELMGSKSKKLIYSIPDFELLDVSSFDTPFSNSWRKNGDLYYFSAQQIENYVNNEPTNAAIIIRNDNNQLSALFPKNIEKGGSGFSPFTESFTQNELNETFISLMYDNTFYQLKNKEAIPLMSVDFGSYAIDHSIGTLSLERQMEYLSAEIEGKASFPVLNFHNSRFTAFSYYYKQNGENLLHQYIKFNQNGKIYHTKSFLNDFTTFPNEVYLSSYFLAINHEIVYKDFLVDIILPWYSLNGEKEMEVEGLGLIQAEDNPIVMLMKLK